MSQNSLSETLYIGLILNGWDTMNLILSSSDSLISSSHYNSLSESLALILSDHKASERDLRCIVSIQNMTKCLWKGALRCQSPDGFQKRREEVVIRRSIVVDFRNDVNNSLFDDQSRVGYICVVASEQRVSSFFLRFLQLRLQHLVTPFRRRTCTYCEWTESIGNVLICFVSIQIESKCH